MLNMEEEGNKWACSQCTYLNYNGSIKCTMCGTKKVSNLIVDSSTDIYQLGCQGNKPKQPCIREIPLQDVEKWSCPKCTFLNFPRSQKCTQCLYTRVNLSEQMARLNVGKSHASNTNKIPSAINTINQTNLELAEAGPCIRNEDQQIKHGQKSRLNLSCSESDTVVTRGAGRISPRHDSREGLTPQDATLVYKWRCRGCTYENWPRSTKCVMCNTSKGSLPQTLQNPPARLATPPPPPNEPRNNKANSSKSSSSEPSNSATRTDTNSDSKDKRQAENNAKNCENINEINKSRSESTESITAIRNSSSQSNSPIIACAVPTVPTSNSPLSSPQQSQLPQAIHQQAVSSLRSVEGAMALNNYETERLLRQLRRRLRDADWVWLNACVGVVEGNYEPVEAYLSMGGDPMRQLSNTDVKLLARPSAFDEGHTLVHLAIRFGREDLLATILSRMDGGGSGAKRVPPYVAPDLATDIRRHIATSIRQRKGSFPCHFVTEQVIFSLPAEIEELPSTVQERLFEELLDRDAQKQLEEDAPIINWSLEITDRLGSRLYALWNRTAGDCLLDSLLQATWGVFDRDNALRSALADSLSEASHIFYPRWKEYEKWQARLLEYYVPESQVLEEWAELVCLASQPGAALEQLHIFVLAHILRRPIIVYGVKCVKSFRGEDLGYARFEGVYLPMLWEPSFCWKSPIALGYTRGHFSALVPMEPDSLDNLGAGAILDAGESQIVFLPLMTHDAKLLPVHFVSQAEIGCEESVLREWLEVCESEGGIMVAQQHLIKKPLNVAQMIEEWLNHYRRLAQMECAPFSRPLTTQGYSSDGDSEEE